MRTSVTIPMGRITLALFAAAASCVTAIPAVAQSSPAKTAGVYSTAQADRGAATYKSECSRCHEATDHSNADFRQAWNGRTVRALFDYLRNTMPDDAPGELAQKDYLDVTAYLLKLNGMPAGDSALVADTTALNRMRIDIKAPAGPASLRQRQRH